MIEFQLSEGELADFRFLFSRGAVWSGLRDDGEAMRYWHVLEETPDRVRMHHGNGAVAILSLENDRITGVDLLQGDEAEDILRDEGLRIPGKVRRRASRFLLRGKPVKEAMEAAWPSGLGLSLLSSESTGDGSRMMYRFSWGGVLEVETDRQERIRGYRFHQGGKAIDLIRTSLRKRS